MPPGQVRTNPTAVTSRIQAEITHPRSMASIERLASSLSIQASRFDRFLIAVDFFLVKLGDTRTGAGEITDMTNYHYKCSHCGTRSNFRMRATPIGRHCPHCGTEITPVEIERQRLMRRIWGVIVLLAFTIFGVCFLIGSGFWTM